MRPREGRGPGPQPGPNLSACRGASGHLGPPWPDGHPPRPEPPGPAANRDAVEVDGAKEGQPKPALRPVLGPEPPSVKEAVVGQESQGPVRAPAHAPGTAGAHPVLRATLHLLAAALPVNGGLGGAPSSALEWSRARGRGCGMRAAARPPARRAPRRSRARGLTALGREPGSRRPPGEHPGRQGARPAQLARPGASCPDCSAGTRGPRRARPLRPHVGIYPRAPAPPSRSPHPPQHDLSGSA